MCPEPDNTEEDESEMTSIMSAEERSLLQDATRGGTQERATARPPESKTDPLVIPKAAPVPRADGAASSATPAAPATPAATPAAAVVKPPPGIPLAVVVPFVALALIILYALTAMR